MAKDSNPEGESAAKGRNKKGQFLEGNKEGTKWTKENHPISNGRPRTRTLTDALLRHLDKPAEAFTFTKTAAAKVGLDPTKVSCFEVLMATTIYHGVKGKENILKQMWERIEGAVPKHVTLGTDDPVQVYIDGMRAATQPKAPKKPAKKKRKKPKKKPKGGASGS